eukprot:Ihof_evm1s736 gene=Ihof_evmTU1s736
MSSEPEHVKEIRSPVSLHSKVSSSPPLCKPTDQPSPQHHGIPSDNTSNLDTIPAQPAKSKPESFQFLPPPPRHKPTGVQSTKLTIVTTKTNLEHNTKDNNVDIMPPPPPKRSVADKHDITLMPPPPKKNMADTHDVILMPPPSTSRKLKEDKIVNEALVDNKEEAKSTMEHGGVQKSHPVHQNALPRQTDQPVALPLPYNEPDWSVEPEEQFSLEVVKGGVVVEVISLKEKAFYTVGRLPICDITMEHPSISRYHAVIQHRDNGGVYLYDLGSTHGTHLNKAPLKPQTYYRIKIGHMIQFGQSTRMLMLVGPEEVAQAEEEEANVVQRQRLMEALQAKKREQRVEEEVDEGCGWGQQEDAVDDDEQEELSLRDGALAKQSLGVMVEEEKGNK